MPKIRPRSHILFPLLAGMLCAVQVQAASPQLPELTIDLAGIGTNQCRTVEWTLPHTQLQVLVCNQAGNANDRLTGVDKAPVVNDSELRQQAVAWREKTVNSALAYGILSMQTALDKLPQRSLHPHWRVLINHGVFGCATATKVVESTIEFADPCNQNRYAADGRALDAGYPSLAIPPYTVQGAHIILGRMPANLAKPEELPAVVFDTTDTPAEQLVRAARWGRVQQASQLVQSGVDVNATVAGGSTALLIAVQMRQPEMVAFLIGQGANVNLCYPDGLTALKISQIVKAPEIEARLLKGGAQVECSKQQLPWSQRS